MEQYWYKPEKRIKRINDNESDVLNKISELKANGYVQVLDRRNPEGSIAEKSKPKAEPKPKKAKKKSKK
tara:strand:- start:1519 stop:1725 length:207 start_codon:yes stop_codon:yes gene_type:complete